MSNLEPISDIPQAAAMAEKFPYKRLIMLTPEMAKEIADYRFDMRISSENEAFRRLLRFALDAAKKPTAQPDARKVVRERKDG